MPPRPRAGHAIGTTTTASRRVSAIIRSRRRRADAGPPRAAFSIRARPAEFADRDRGLYDPHPAGGQPRGRRRVPRQHGQMRQERCNAEVILAAGAVKSPHLLELSGIGQPELFAATSRHRGEARTARRGRKLPRSLRAADELAREAAGHAERADAGSRIREGDRQILHAGPRGTRRSPPASSTGSFLKTRPELEEPDVQYHFAHASYATAQTRILDREPGMTLTAYQCSPELRGSILTRSPPIRLRLLRSGRTSWPRSRIAAPSSKA